MSSIYLTYSSVAINHWQIIIPSILSYLMCHFMSFIFFLPSKLDVKFTYIPIYIYISHVVRPPRCNGNSIASGVEYHKINVVGHYIQYAFFSTTLSKLPECCFLYERSGLLGLSNDQCVIVLCIFTVINNHVVCQRMLTAIIINFTSANADWNLFRRFGSIRNLYYRDFERY
jgi:hypothetical protein